MPIAEVNAISQVKRSRRVAQRVADRVKAGTLKPGEVDLADLMFGRSSVDDKLAKVGFLDEDFGLDELAEAYAKSMVWVMDRAGKDKVDELDRKIREKLAQARVPGKRDPIFPGRMNPSGRTEESERIIARDDASAARVLAVHLHQRAFYRALSLAMLKLVTDQMEGNAKPGFEHGVIKMGPVRDAECDVVIDKVRRRVPSDV